MVLITREEKDQIIKQYPHVHIVRTVKSKSNRHRYYMEEAKGAMAMLDRIRHPERKPKYNERNNNPREGKNNRNGRPRRGNNDDRQTAG